LRVSLERAATASAAVHAEGLLLAASGGVLGVLAGWFGLRLIGGLPALQLPRMEGIRWTALHCC